MIELFITSSQVVKYHERLVVVYHKQLGLVEELKALEVLCQKMRLWHFKHNKGY